jgi:hypothetical protein
MPMDFYFLVDRSGSMAGIKWEKAVLAVQSSVGSLTQSDRAMVTLFNSKYNDFAEKPLPPQQLLAENNFQNLGQLEPEGGTELGAALRHVVEVANNHSRTRQKSLILITDAQVGNESTILRIMESAPEFPLHCFGIDVALNDSLLLALARQQRGTFHSFNPKDDVAKAVTDLAQTIRHPVLSQLRIADGWETAEAWLPPLYSGQVYYLSARSVKQDALEIIAKNADGTGTQIRVNCQTTAREAPYLHWCKNRIQRHIAERQEVEAVALSEESNLICPLTAFVAWDETEKVAIACHTLIQPPLEVGDKSAIMNTLLCAEPARAFAALALLKKAQGAKPLLLQRLSRKLRNSAAAPGATSSTPPGSLPPDPSSVVNRIVEHLNTDYLSYPGEPFTSEERRAAFDKVMEDIRNRLNHPEWKSLCEAILTWTFSDQHEAIHRSNLLAKTLSKLLGQLNEFSALSQSAMTLARNLQDASRSAIEALERIEKTLDKNGITQGSVLDSLNVLRPMREFWRDTGLEDMLVKIARIDQDIHEQLERIVRP